MNQKRAKEKVMRKVIEDYQEQRMNNAKFYEETSRIVRFIDGGAPGFSKTF